MNHSTDHALPLDDLRRRAEVAAQADAESAPRAQADLSPEATRHLLHELQVHQIELEIQNEELRRTQVELEASRARWVDLYELAPTGYCTVDEAGLILEANFCAAMLLGPARSTLIGQPFSRFIARDDQDRYYHLRQRLRNGTGPNSCELRLLRADGSTCWVLLAASRVLDDVGTPVWRVVLSDITERKLSDASLRDSEARLGLIFARVPAALAVFDQEMRYLVVSRRWLEDFGLGDADVIGRSHYEVFPDIPERWRSAHRRALKGEVVSADDDMFERANGAIQWLHWEVLPWYTSDSTIGGIVMIAEDITRYRRAADEIRALNVGLEARVNERTAELVLARDVAERLVRMKGEFLATISHEIRTPLNAVAGMSYMLRHSGLTPEQTRQLDKLEDANQYLEHIVNSVLDLSRIESGKFVLERAPVDVQQIITHSVAMVETRAQAKGIGLRIEAESLPAHLLGDPTRIQQALLNYLTNAIKFSQGGVVTVRAGVQPEPGTGGLLRFEVQDTGIGIDAATVARLFVPFEQADSSTARRFGGAGMGLSITKGLALAMGGDAGVDSKPGEGSTFWFTVTLEAPESIEPVRPAAVTVPTESTVRQAWAGRRILVAEDDPVNREILMAMLSAVGPVVDVAHNGLQAVECVRRNEHAYDLILMDMQMPQMDGLEATQHIRRLPKGGDVPIVAVTGNAFTEDRQDCLRAGMNELLAKPLHVESLYAALMKWPRDRCPV